MVQVISILPATMGLIYLIAARRPWVPYEVRRIGRNFAILYLVFAAALFILPEVWQ